MQRCLELAMRGAGSVSPNPLVGSVVINSDGQIMGEGWHQQYGGPHAEHHSIHDALRRHGPEALKEATIYVNLEPCSHFGKTPPCADLILEYGIPRVVIGMVDPHPAVQGRGIQRLRDYGIELSVGVLNQACKRLNEAFSHHIRSARPLVTLKLAQTLDGRIATTSGDSRWVSGKPARTRVHAWRAQVDAVLIGSGTALADNPALTVRHVKGRQPHRIVLDREGLLPENLHLFSDAHAAITIAVVAEDVDPPYRSSLIAAGGHIIKIPVQHHHLDLHTLLDVLGRKDARTPTIQSILVEAGPRLATALFEQDLVDRYFLFIAPKLIGDGMPALKGLSIDKMTDALTFPESTWEQIGDDLLFQGYRRTV